MHAIAARHGSAVTMLNMNMRNPTKHDELLNRKQLGNQAVTDKNMQ